MGGREQWLSSSPGIAGACFPLQRWKTAQRSAGEVLLRVTREDGTEIAQLVRFDEVSKDKTEFKGRLRWLIPSSVILTGEERSKLAEFMEAGNARLRETLKAIYGKTENEKTSQ